MKETIKKVQEVLLLAKESKKLSDLQQRVARALYEEEVLRRWQELDRLPTGYDDQKELVGVLCLPGFNMSEQQIQAHYKKFKSLPNLLKKLVDSSSAGYAEAKHLLCLLYTELGVCSLQDTDTYAVMAIDRLLNWLESLNHAS
mgnify:CR=1 FL=1